MKSNRRNIAIIAAAITVTIIIGIAVYNQFFSTAGYYEKQLEIGNLFLSEEKYEGAIDAFEKAMEIDRQSIPARMGAGDAYAAIEKYEDAERVLREVLAIDENHEDAYSKLINILISVRPAKGETFNRWKSCSERC